MSTANMNSTRSHVRFGSQQTNNKTKSKNDISNFRNILKLQLALFKVETFEDFFKKFELLILLHTFNRWRLFKDKPTIYDFSFGDKSEEIFITQLLNNIMEHTECDKLSELLHENQLFLSDQNIVKYVMNKYNQLAKFFLLIDHIRGFKKDCPNILRTVCSNDKIWGVFVDVSQSKPNLHGYTSGSEEDYHKGFRYFFSLTEECQKEVIEEMYDILNILRLMCVDNHVSFNIFKELQKLLIILISKKDKKNIIRLLSEIYTNNLYELINNDDEIFYQSVEEFNTTENFKEIWNSNKMTIEGRTRVLVIIEFNRTNL